VAKGFQMTKIGTNIFYKVFLCAYQRPQAAIIKNYYAFYCFHLLKITITNISLLSSLTSFSQNYYALKGFVYSESNEPLIGANIRVVNLEIGTTVDIDGKYELRILEGLNRISVSFIGYQTQVFEIVSDRDLVKNIYLKIDQKQLDEVVIRNKKRDFSYEVIKNVIATKDAMLKQFKNYKADVYIKAVEKIEKKQIKVNEIEDPEKNSQPNKEVTKSRLDTLPKLNLFECQLIRYENADGRQKEEKNAVKKVGDQKTLFFKSITDGEFNLYKNHQRIAKISDNEFTSPVSDLAFLSYKFQLIKYTYEEKEKIYYIKVIPRELGNTLYEGEIEVVDEKWVIRKANLKLTKRALMRYDEFSFEQISENIQNRWLPAQTTYNWKIKSDKKTGKTIVIQKNFTFDSTYAKRFFGDEVGLTTEAAYKKDSTFWESIRPKPLEKNEIIAIKEKERLDNLQNSKVFLDSIDRIFNKITIPKIIYLGIGRINRAKKTEWLFDPILGLIDPVAIGGWRVRYGFNYTKRFENRKEISLNTNATYGFNNGDLKGFISANYFYNPIKISSIRLSFGSNFGVINGNATIRDIAKRSNFYQSTFYNLRHSTELFNGFYIATRAIFEQREDLANFKFGRIGDRVFGTENKPAPFPYSQMFKTDFDISYTPRQLYLKEPNQKLILGSKYPSFGLHFEKAWGNSTKNASAFSYIGGSIRQVFNIGIFGTSEYRIKVGKFLDTTRLAVMDYKYQRGGDNYFFSPGMYTYQLIPETFPTFNWYCESHYAHQFNGFLTSKVPLLNKTKIREVAGGGLLFVPERKYQYSELYSGLNRIFKIGKDFIRLGVYYVVSQANDLGFRSGFKFSFEPYNQNRNTWSF
jgi:Family of unknown function (DUF5686)/CarboxypepD_reg-like domain